MLRIFVLLGVVGAGVYQVGYEGMRAEVYGHNDFSSREMRLAISDTTAADESALRRKIDAKPNLATYDVGDAGINAARDEGRATLPRFYQLMEAQTPGTYSIKFPLSGGGVSEHVWVQLTGIEGTNFKGLIANEPALVSGHTLGDPVVVPLSEVSDWMIRSENAIYGGYTMRHSLAKLPAEQAAQITAILKD